ATLSAFLEDPHARYPDGRMPRLPLKKDDAREIAAYLLESSPPAGPEPEQAASTAADRSAIDAVVRRLGVSGLEAAGPALVREKRCLQCHEGLDGRVPEDIPIQAQALAHAGDAPDGCFSGRTLPRFSIDHATRAALAAYLAVAARERYPSPFEAGQRLLVRN